MADSTDKKLILEEILIRTPIRETSKEGSSPPTADDNHKKGNKNKENPDDDSDIPEGTPTTESSEHYNDDDINDYETVMKEQLDTYSWPQIILNENRYGPYYDNLKDEILKNVFFKFATKDYNDTLKKCSNIRSQWLGERIRAYSSGCYPMLNSKWNKGDKVSVIELFAVKLYTDFDLQQRELKLCFRPDIERLKTSSSYRLEFEYRISHFYYWRNYLVQTIKKYGRPLRRKIVYHGINSMMKLSVDPTYRLNGPLSATTSIAIAKGFACKTGIVLELTSKFPRLNYCYYFDVSQISNFPQEKEVLIGFMYSRILKVYMADSKNRIKYKENIMQLSCFILELLRINVYSMDLALEHVTKALFITDNEYNKTIFNYNDDKIIDVYTLSQQIPSIITNKFINFRQKKHILKLDQISNALKIFFYEENNQYLSWEKVHKYMPQLHELHLYENFILDNTLCDKFNKFITKYKYIKLKKVVFYQYNFDGDVNQFQWIDKLNKTNKTNLLSNGWKMKPTKSSKGYVLTLSN